MDRRSSFTRERDSLQLRYKNSVLLHEVEVVIRTVFKACEEKILAWLSSPNSCNINFLLAISMHDQEKGYDKSKNDH